MEIGRIGRGLSLVLLGSRGRFIRCQEQFAYGHVDWIRKYACLPPDVYVEARLPHGGWGGWESPPEDASVAPFRSISGRVLPVLTWTKSWREFFLRNGAGRAIDIGAPWLYMLLHEGFTPAWDEDKWPGRLQQASLRAEVDRRQTLYVPTHSWEREIVDLKGIGGAIASALDAEKTSILLGWADYLDPEVRSLFESHGFQVLCAGYRGGAEAPESHAGARSSFLRNLLTFYLAHEEVVADVPCTALLYAASIGLPTAVPDSLRSLRRSLVETLRSDFTNPTDYLRTTDRLDLQYAWLTDPDWNPVDVRAHARIALGATSLRSPDWLASNLAWRRIP